MTTGKNRLHLYTGDGKGKTSIAVGMAIRAIGAGMSVAFIQFDKGFDGGEDLYNERQVLRSFDQVYLFSSGLNRMQEDGGFRMGVTDNDRVEAKVGMEKAAVIVTEGKFEMVILDEAITSVGYGLIDEESVMEIIANWENSDRPCELVLTGRGAWRELIDKADLVSEVKKIKHYYDDGHQAKRGVEY
jgi:cob(I)alamin adenosyltransferase